MAIASQSGSTILIQRSGMSEIPTKGLYGNGTYTYQQYSTVSFLYRRTFTTDALGGNKLTFTVTGATTWLFDDWYARTYGFDRGWRQTGADGQTISLSGIGTKFYVSSSSTYNSSATLTACTVSGTTVTGTLNISLSPNTTYYIFIVGSAENGAVDGTVSATVSGSYGTPGVPNASNGTFGSAVSISITGGTSSASYTVTTSCAGRTETLQTKSTTTSLSWTPEVSTYAPLVTNASSTTATITVETYYSGVSIGKKTKTITMAFRVADVKPSVTMAVSDPTGLATTYGAFVATKSKIKAQLTVTTQYGATASTYTITANGSSYNTNPATTSEIASASNNTVTGKITDSRGISSNTALQTISVLAYTQPQINGFTIHRCLQDGTLDDSGAYMRVDYNVSITALNNVNSKALVVKYKKRVDANYSSETVTLTAYTQSGSAVIAADTNFTYDVQLELTDDFSTVTISLQLSTAFATLNFRAGGKGIAVGKVSEQDKVFELATGWSLKIGNETLSESDLAALLALLS